MMKLKMYGLPLTDGRTLGSHLTIGPRLPLRDQPHATICPHSANRLAGVTQAELDEVARKLNRRPRHTLGFRTPAEKLTELIDGLHTGNLASAYGLRSTAPGVG